MQREEDIVLLNCFLLDRFDQILAPISLTHIATIGLDTGDGCHLVLLSGVDLGVEREDEEELSS